MNKLCTEVMILLITLIFTSLSRTHSRFLIYTHKKKFKSCNHQTLIFLFLHRTKLFHLPDKNYIHERNNLPSSVLSGFLFNFHIKNSIAYHKKKTNTKKKTRG